MPLTVRATAVACLCALLGCSADTRAAVDAAPAPAPGGDAAAPAGAPTADGSPGASTTGAPRPVTIAFAGDVHYERGLRTALLTEPARMLEGVAPVLQGADLAVVNLETAIGSGGERQAKAFTFQAPPPALDALRSAGVDVISMANNHAIDFGPPGLDQTLAAIRERSAPVIGIGVDEAAAYRPLVAEVNGRRIAFIAATEVLDSNLVSAWTATPERAGVASAKRLDRLVAEVREARRISDTVVVFLHWGTEKAFCPDPDQLRIAPELVAAGADVVAGGHAHRVQGAGYLGRAYVAYGLGNFQFLANSADGRESGVLTLTVDGRIVTNPVWHPARIGTDNLPSLLRGSEESAARKRWEQRRNCAELAAAPSGEAQGGAGG